MLLVNARHVINAIRESILTKSYSNIRSETVIVVSFKSAEYFQDIFFLNKPFHKILKKYTYERLTVQW